MRLLIDTHCWLWWFGDPDRLNDDAKRLIANKANTVYLSSASSWEIAIKAALGKLQIPEPPGKYVPSRLSSQGMSSLPIEHRHALHVFSLPHHHRDPFDRMLVAQAQVESLPILTADQLLSAYDVKLIWAGAASH
jgi:PIN domain nuclease of toxin-antitoxin system